MNKQRRAALSVLIGQLEEIHSQIETLKDEEQDYYDNMPESFQRGNKGDSAQNAVSELENAAESVQSAVDSIANADPT